MGKPKSKKEEVTIPLVLLPFVSDSEEELNNSKFLCEMVLYQYFLRTHQGAVNRVWAFVVPVEKLRKIGDDQYDAYVDLVVASKKKFGIGFEIDIEHKGELDEL